MALAADFKTKPIESWAKMKELRRAHFRHTWEAQSRGEPVIVGVVEAFLSFLAGLGDFANPSFGPYFTVMMRNPDQLVKCLEAVEARGFSRDLCSSMRCHLGQLHLGLVNKNPLGGYIKPDFIFQHNFCHSAVKTGQLFKEHLGLPYFILDVPLTETPNTHGYLLQQLQEAIPWLEKASGRKFDDEKLIEATEIEWECAVTWARICELQKAIPAPLDMRQLWSLRLPLVTMRHKRETLEYIKMLYDEVRYRVSEGISARGVERARLLQEGIPPFYCIQVLRFPADYGAITVGGEILFVTFAAWETLGDGSWRPAPTLRERGITLRTREDALRAQVELNMDYAPNHRFCLPTPHPQEYVKRAQDWRAHGVILHLDRGCKGYQAGMMECKWALQQEGIPTLAYEGSQADPRDFSLPQVQDQMGSFLESLGLSRVATAEEEAGDAL